MWRCRQALVAEGLVEVDGQVETRKRCKIVAEQVVNFNGMKVVVKEGVSPDPLILTPATQALPSTVAERAVNFNGMKHEGRGEGEQSEIADTGEQGRQAPSGLQLCL